MVVQYIQYLQSAAPYSFSCDTGSATACVQQIFAAGPMLMQLAYVCGSCPEILSERTVSRFVWPSSNVFDQGIGFCQACGQLGDMAT
jgi:hypothetical protein